MQGTAPIRRGSSFFCGKHQKEVRMLQDFREKFKISKIATTMGRFMSDTA